MTTVWTITRCLNPSPHDLDTNDLIEAACDAVVAVCASEETAVAKAEQLARQDAEYGLTNEDAKHVRQLVETDETGTTFIVAGLDLTEMEACCWYRVVQHELV